MKTPIRIATFVFKKCILWARMWWTLVRLPFVWTSQDWSHQVWMFDESLEQFHHQDARLLVDLGTTSSFFSFFGAQAYDHSPLIFYSGICGFSTSFSFQLWLQSRRNLNQFVMGLIWQERRGKGYEKTLLIAHNFGWCRIADEAKGIGEMEVEHLNKYTRHSKAP